MCANKFIFSPKLAFHHTASKNPNFPPQNLTLENNKDDDGLQSSSISPSTSSLANFVFPPPPCYLPHLLVPSYCFFYCTFLYSFI